MGAWEVPLKGELEGKTKIVLFDDVESKEVDHGSFIIDL
jgi:hypothetical protein